jgi:hypothetical protein
MTEIERVRKKSNQNIPIKYSKDSAYVLFEFALRAAVFVAVKFRLDLLKLNHLSFRLNMDGTLMNNKHVVAISVNCVDGGFFCLILFFLPYARIQCVHMVRESEEKQKRKSILTK